MAQRSGQCGRTKPPRAAGPCVQSSPLDQWSRRPTGGIGTDPEVRVHRLGETCGGTLTRPRGDLAPHPPPCTGPSQRHFLHAARTFPRARGHPQKPRACCTLCPSLPSTSRLGGFGVSVPLLRPRVGRATSRPFRMESTRGPRQIAGPLPRCPAATRRAPASRPASAGVCSVLSACLVWIPE